MTKRVNRPYKKRGRVPKVAPASAAQRIEMLAATGHSLVGIARGLNTSKDVLSRWLDDDPTLAEALARGREAERFALHDVLFRAAKRGNIVAAMFLLKARHGYREGDQTDAANRVTINFTLPAPLKPEQFRTIEHEPANKTLSLPEKDSSRA